jgi:hypothetical protein
MDSQSQRKQWRLDAEQEAKGKKMNIKEVCRKFAHTTNPNI